MKAPQASQAPAGLTPPGRPRIGLALGSGSARGLAHIGVLRALKEAGITSTGWPAPAWGQSSVPSLPRANSMA